MPSLGGICQSERNGPAWGNKKRDRRHQSRFETDSGSLCLETRPEIGGRSTQGLRFESVFWVSLFFLSVFWALDFLGSDFFASLDFDFFSEVSF